MDFSRATSSMKRRQRTRATHARHAQHASISILSHCFSAAQTSSGTGAVLPPPGLGFGEAAAEEQEQKHGRLEFDNSQFFSKKVEANGTYQATINTEHDTNTSHTEYSDNSFLESLASKWEDCATELLGIFSMNSKGEGGASEQVDGEFGNEATQGEYASDYVSNILEELEKWQYVGPASHSFVRLKQRVEQATLEESKLTMEIEQLEKDVALNKNLTKEELDDLCIRYSRFFELPGLTFKHKETLEQSFDDLQESCGNHIVVPDHGADGLLLDQIYEILCASQPLSIEGVRERLPFQRTAAEASQALEEWMGLTIVVRSGDLYTMQTF